MARDCATIDRGEPLADVAQELLRTGRRCFFVMDDGRVAGRLTPHEIRTVERDRWPSTPAGQAMRPVERLHRIAAEAPVMEALEVIGARERQSAARVRPRATSWRHLAGSDCAAARGQSGADVDVTGGYAQDATRRRQGVCGPTAARALVRAPLDPSAGRTFRSACCSRSTISTIVLSTESGFSEMLSIPSTTRKRANSG
jgi:hypothetical protein